MPLPHCLFTFFCVAGILLRNYYSFSPPPSTLSPPRFFAFLSLCTSFFFWRQVYLEIAGGGGWKLFLGLCLPVFDTTVCTRAPVKVCRVVFYECLRRESVHVPPFHSLGLLSYISHLKSFICTKPLLQTLLPWLQPSEDHWHNDRHSGHGNPMITSG